MNAPLIRALARAAVAAAALAALLPATAQDAARGKTLYEKTFVPGVRSCLSCHGTPQQDPIVHRGTDAYRIRGAAMTQSQMKPLYGVITDAEYNDMAAYLVAQIGGTPTYIAVSSAPAPSASPTTVTFGAQQVGTTSAAQTVTVSNGAGATAALGLSAIGTGAGSDFAVSGGSCVPGNGIAAGGSCTVLVTFKPAAAGARTGTLTLAHNGPGGKTEVALSGQAVNSSPVAALSPVALAFSSAVNTDSNVMRATLSNTGNAPLALASVTLGGTHAAEFRLAPSTTCASGGSVAGGSSCVVDVVFKPTATGPRSASVAIAHNAAGGAAAVALNGTGTLTPEPVLALDATDLDVGMQPVATTGTPRTVTLTNAGGAALTLSSLALGGTDAGDFVLGGTCQAGTPVASRGTCTLTVALRPQVLGAKSATLTVSSNAPGGAATIALRGTAVRTPAPAVALSQAAIGFGTVTLGTTAVARTVLLTNSGSAAMQVTSIKTASLEFKVSHDCPTSLAVGASCLVTVAYAPTAAIAAEAVEITTDALSSPNSIVLTGQGSSQAMSVLAWQGASASLNFASTVVGEPGASKSLTLVNQGPGAVTLSTLGTAGASAGAFAIDAASTCKLGLALAANGTCTVVVTFAPSSAGTHAASLQVAGNGTPPGDITLTGTAARPATPTGALAANVASLDFSATPVAPGSSSASKAVKVSNTGTGPAAVRGVTVSGPFAIQAGGSGACPTGASTLAAGASCTVTLVFSPTVTGTATGRLTVDATSTKATVDLKGLALAPTAGALTATPAQVGFTTPNTLPGQTSVVQTVTLSNGAVAAVTVGMPQVTGPFRIAASTCGATIAVNASCTLSVVFAPTAAGTATGELSVTTGSGQVVQVALSGASSNGTTPGGGMPGGGTPGGGNSTVLSADNASLFFTGALGTPTTPQTVKVTNRGMGPLVLGTVTVSGHFDEVASTAAACKPAMTLAPGTACDIAIAFRAPMSTGDFSGDLTVTATAPDSTNVEVRSVRLDGRAVVLNAGGRDDDAVSGGGASDRVALLLLALFALALMAPRPRRDA